jgi:hypothetical protein
MATTMDTTTTVEAAAGRDPEATAAGQLIKTAQEKGVEEFRNYTTDSKFHDRVAK